MVKELKKKGKRDVRGGEKRRGKEERGKGKGEIESRLIPLKLFLCQSEAEARAGVGGYQLRTCWWGGGGGDKRLRRVYVVWGGDLTY